MATVNSIETFHETQGVLYVATGGKYRELLLQSLKHLRRVEPSVSVMVVSDRESIPALEPWSRKFKFSIVQLEDPRFGFVDKINGMALSPFEKTVFLDCDTVPIRRFANDLFVALDQSEIVALPGMSLNHQWEESYSAAISQFNTGVIAYTRSVLDSSFFANWYANFEGEENPTHDQPSFRATVLDLGIKVAPLAVEYNFMGNGSVFEPRILHFTAWRRIQVFYQSQSRRTNLINRFLQEGYGGFFANFSEADSVNSVRGTGPGSRIHWWVSGAWSWVLFRARRYVVGGLNRLGAFLEKV